MASVKPFKNPSGATVWRVQGRHQRRSRQETFQNDTDAHKFGEMADKFGWDVAKEMVERARQSLAPSLTFGEWATEYLDPASGLLTGIEPGTRAGYVRIAKSALIPVLGEYPIDMITKADIGKWVEWQERQKSGRKQEHMIAAKTVRNHHALLSNILKAAVEQGHRVGNPAHKTRISEGIPREPVFLSRDEFAAVYAEIPEYYRPLTAFLVGAQARWSEATALDSTDVHRDTVPPTVRINKAWKKSAGGTPVIGPPKSRRARRTVSLWPELVAMLDANPGFLFKGKASGRRMWYGSFNDRIWHRAVERSGIGKDPNIHDLRHTGASWLIADGKPLPFIQNRLGHESITTTINIYGHLLPDAHTQMADSMALIMGNVLPITRELGSKISDSTDTTDDGDGRTIGT